MEKEEMYIIQLSSWRLFGDYLAILAIIWRIQLTQSMSSRSVPF